MSQPYQWDKRQEKIAKEVSDEYKVLTTQTKQAIEIIMRLALSYMRQFIPVTLPNLGRFFLSPWKSTNNLVNIFRARRNGTINEEELRHKLSIYLPIHKIAIKHAIRTGRRYRIEKLKRDGLYGTASYREKLQLAKQNREKKQSEAS